MPKMVDGTVAERPNAPALKADVPRGTESSNLSRSALYGKCPGHRLLASKMAATMAATASTCGSADRP